jgi:hypothetical protein
MRENHTSGSVRGALGDQRSYRAILKEKRFNWLNLHERFL